MVPFDDQNLAFGVTYVKGIIPKSAGVSQQLISQLERGENASTKELPDLARALKKSVYEIDPKFTPEGDAPLIRVPLISWVSAGNLRAPEAVEDLENAPRVSAPDLDPKGEWIALQVEGDSMDRISPPDSVIFVNLKEKRLAANACYVVADANSGEASYKRYRPDPERLEPVSTKDHPTLYLTPDRRPRIIGRVRKSVLSM